MELDWNVTGNCFGGVTYDVYRDKRQPVKKNPSRFIKTVSSLPTTDTVGNSQTYYYALVAREGVLTVDSNEATVDVTTCP